MKRIKKLTLIENTFNKVTLHIYKSHALPKRECMAFEIIYLEAVEALPLMEFHI